jgi:glycine reductase
MPGVKTVHYLNQFFGGIGGEDKAGEPWQARDGALPLGARLAEAFGGTVEIVGTVICGDNYAAENMDALVRAVLKEVGDAGAGFFIAGPSFGSGRYGMACASLCLAVSKELKIPVITGMNPVSPGVDIARRDMFIVHTGDSARDMQNAVAGMARLGNKLLANEPVGFPEEEGYIPRGIRINVREEKRGSRRAVDMLLKRLNNQPFVTELPMPVFDRVPPAPAVRDLKNALIAIGTEGGIVPKGNPDRIEAHNASKWRCYNIAGIDKLARGEYEVAHGGYDPVHANENPNRVLPLDVARACRKEAAFGELFNGYPVTVGNVTAVRSAEKYGREIGEMLKKEKVDGIVLTST